MHTDSSGSLAARLGVSEIRGPQSRSLNSRILIIRIPK